MGILFPHRWEKLCLALNRMKLLIVSTSRRPPALISKYHLSEQKDNRDAVLKLHQFFLTLLKIRREYFGFIVLDYSFFSDCVYHIAYQQCQLQRLLYIRMYLQENTGFFHQIASLLHINGNSDNKCQKPFKMQNKRK